MRTLVFLCFSLLGLACSAQTPTNSDSRKISAAGELSNEQRYGVDYELVDYPFDNGDSTILDLLDLTSIEYLRHDTFDQAYRDLDNHVVILLYSRRRMTGKDQNEIKSHH